MQFMEQYDDDYGVVGVNLLHTQNFFDSFMVKFISKHVKFQTLAVS